MTKLNYSDIRIIRLANYRWLPVCFLISLVSIFGGCAINPATGGVDFVTMSEESEIKLGAEKHAEFLEGNPVYSNEELAAYVNQVGQRVAKTSDRPDLKFYFTIIDDKQVNAFALPGGYIYITRGLMTYLNAEEELAAVLAHEVGHVTARHHVRQKSSEVGKNVGDAFASILSVLTTGTNVLGDVSNLYSTAAYLGYGREHELEADQFGARYLHNAGYDPQAMVKVIGILKDQERFSRRQAKDQGQKNQAYHGVFSSHPRNDQRLREVVNAAGKLDAKSERIADIGNYREMTEGLIFGVNYELSFGKKDDPRRYTHRNLGFTLLMPDQWVADNQQKSIVFAQPENQASLTLEVNRLNANVSPSEYIRKELKVPLLTRSEPFAQYGLIGHMGLMPAEGESYPQRVAVLYQANRVYVFTGKIETQGEEVDYDQMFVDTIRSFRPVRVANPRNEKSQKIHYVRANDKTTFAILAKLSPLKRYAEEELRLLNGYYPSGEPRKGEWIKIIQ